MIWYLVKLETIGLTSKRHFFEIRIRIKDKRLKRKREITLFILAKTNVGASND